MKKLTLVLALCAISALALAKEPKDTLAAFHAALKDGDQAKASEFLAPDVTIYESGFAENSRAEYAGHHLPEDIKFSKIATRKLLRQTERSDGNLAVIWEETETSAELKGKQVRYFGTETTLLQKIGENWHILHMHWSSRKAK